ncbi:putative ABC transporter ATP-binding protein YxlF [Planctomycetes bacterium MalM25]|nr:putative ABC transporter ATP-binding protein YxlF [Planctomycetes bacterium MalM25]
MTQPAIETIGVAKSFGKKLVVRDVSLKVEPGQTYAFLGRNGEGKTTTIRMLLGLLKPDEGSIQVAGCDPATDPLTLRDRVGYLAEDQTMYGWMTVDEIVRFVAPFYSRWDHDLARRYLDEFDLPLRTKIKHLSKGQTVRLGLVLALAHRPEVVILDDPALGLDPIMRKQFNRDLITHLQGEGRAVFYSSHLLHEVEPVADQVAILHGGRIVRQGETEELRADVKQLFIRPERLPIVSRYGTVLDIRPDGDELAVTQTAADLAADALAREGVPFNVVELNLDEIFEAYVAGQPELPREQPAPAEETAA